MLQEEIEAKRETSGNYSAMILLLENLRRRENWPDQFISALQTCEQRALANVISEAYDNIRGIRSMLISIIKICYILYLLQLFFCSECAPALKM